MIPTDSNSVITSITLLIQLAVAPVFLLAGVAGLLNVFTSRFTRIVDKLERIDHQVSTQKKKDENYIEDNKLHTRRQFFAMRMSNINRAILFCTATGLLVALVILTVFASALLSFNSDYFIAVFFIVAMFFLIISLVLFLREIYFTAYFINKKRCSIDNN